MAAFGGWGFIDWLVDQNLLSREDADRCRRVVIDAPHDGAVTMYIERLADSKLLDSEMPQEIRGGLKTEILDVVLVEKVPAGPEMVGGSYPVLYGLETPRLEEVEGHDPNSA